MELHITNSTGWMLAGDSQALAGDSQALLGLVAFFLLWLRVSAVLAMTPVLYAMPMPGRVRILLVLTLAGAVAGSLSPSAASSSFSFGFLLQSALTEVALGATLALGILLAFAAFSITGALLDVQIGFGIAQIIDPATSRPVPLLVSAFNYSAVLVFFLVDGHHALLRGIAFSLQAFPVGMPWSVDGASGSLLRQVGGLFGIGFALAAPVVFCVLLAELALGTIARSLPQINMFALGIPVKIIVGITALSFWFAGMGGSMTNIYSGIYSTWNEIFFDANSVRSQPVAPSIKQPSMNEAR